MPKQWRYGQGRTKGRFLVELPPHLLGLSATIKAGSKSLYGIEFTEPTPCVFDKNWDAQPGYYAMKLKDGRVALVFREDVESEHLK